MAHFFNISPENLTTKLLERYAKACTVIKGVGIASCHEHIQVKLIDPIASAKRCYTYGENLACIELCALQGEMLANFLCIINKENLRNESVINKLKDYILIRIMPHMGKDDFYDLINQLHRIEWLLKGTVISQEHFDDLKTVHEIRKKYFHHWDQLHNNIEDDALEALSRISKIASNYLEILEKPVNISRVIQYMAMH